MYARKRRRLALEHQKAQALKLQRLWESFPDATDYAGIDYRGWSGERVNQHGEFHYGIVPMNSLAYWAWDSIEADYGEPCCPKCGNEAVDGDSDIPEDVRTEDEDRDFDGLPREDLGYEVLHHACGDYACDSCHVLFDGEDAFGDEPIGHDLDDGEYVGHVDRDCIDMFLFRSPYYTLAQYCSPCAPGAGYLLNPCPCGVKTYALGHDWFEEDRAPYPIWNCRTNKLVKPKK